MTPGAPLFVTGRTMRARIRCSGPNQENMETWLSAMFVERFRFAEHRPEEFRRAVCFDEPERAEFLKALWQIQLTFGPETILEELEVWHGTEIKLLIRKT